MADVSEIDAATAAELRVSAAAYRPASLAAQTAWVLADSGRAPYSSLIGLFVFSAYFTTVVVPDPVHGQSLWSYIVATAALIIGIGAPLLGPIADAGGRIKPWLAAFILLGLPAIGGLWFATPAMPAAGLRWIVLALIVAKISIEYASVFVNALLPRVVGRDRLGLLSGMGQFGSNLLNIAVLLFFLLAWSWNRHPLFGLNAAAHEPQRATGIVVALCFGLFSVPLFFLSPDAPAAARSRREAMREGLRSLRGTIAKLRLHPNASQFLIARTVYNEGLIIMMMFTGIFAAGVLKWSPTMLVIQGILNSVCAAVAGFAAARIDRRIGSKASVVLFVTGALMANIVLCTVSPGSVLGIATSAVGDGGMFPRVADKTFMVLNALVAVSVTGGFAASRTMMAKLSPPTMLAEFFSLYALSGTATSFVGPLAIGILTAIFHSQRAGIAVGLAFFVGGLLLLRPVREDETG
ncbi:MFS transporter [soil metagenome]